MKQGFVYILTNKYNNVFYTGVTNNLLRRVTEHKNSLSPGTAFTKRYNVTKLVYFEQSDSIVSAIEREKQIKTGSRKKKIELIRFMNPEWKDLADSIGG